MRASWRRTCLKHVLILLVLDALVFAGVWLPMLFEWRPVYGENVEWTLLGVGIVSGTLGLILLAGLVLLLSFPAPDSPYEPVR